jgi:hypothetical protein
MKPVTLNQLSFCISKLWLSIFTMLIKNGTIATNPKGGATRDYKICASKRYMVKHPEFPAQLIFLAFLTTPANLNNTFRLV